jgi:hypothetical protein
MKHVSRPTCGLEHYSSDIHDIQIYTLESLGFRDIQNRYTLIYKSKNVYLYISVYISRSPMFSTCISVYLYINAYTWIYREENTVRERRIRHTSY